VVICDEDREGWPVVYANPAFWDWVMVDGGGANHSIVEFLEDPILADPDRINHDGRHIVLNWRHNDTRWEEQITYLIRINRNGRPLILFCFYPYELHHIPELPDHSPSDEQHGPPEDFSNLEALGQLSAGIAHDFNNILSVIEGFTHMIIRRHQAGRPAI
jgi:signal transduction histidine kinase